MYRLIRILLVVTVAGRGKHPKIHPYLAAWDPPTPGFFDRVRWGSETATRRFWMPWCFPVINKLETYFPDFNEEYLDILGFKDDDMYWHVMLVDWTWSRTVKSIFQQLYRWLRVACFCSFDVWLMGQACHFLFCCLKRPRPCWFNAGSFETRFTGEKMHKNARNTFPHGLGMTILRMIFPPRQAYMAKKQRSLLSRTFWKDMLWICRWGVTHVSVLFSYHRNLIHRRVTITYMYTCIMYMYSRYIKYTCVHFTAYI